MHIRLCTVLIVLIVFGKPVLAQESFTQQPSVELPAELDRVLRDYEKAWKNGESETLATLFVEGGYVPTPDGWIKGRAAIQKKYQQTGGDLVLRAISYSMEGSVGFIVGAYGYGEDAGEKDRGNFVLALERSDDGTWYIVADLDKSNR